MKTFQEFMLIAEALDPKFGSMRKRGGRSAPPEERSVGGEMNRRNKDYWADTQGPNRDRGAGNKARRRAAALNTEEVEVVEGVRPTPVDKPLDKPAFKKRRRSLAGREASADARARGHEGKTWADSGRTYSPDEAKSRRKNMSDTHRSLSYGTAESPDDNTGYPAVKTKNPKKLRKQKAMGEHG